MTLLCACGRQRRRLHCGSSRASERRHRPPPPAPFQPRTPAPSARPAAFHPPRGGAALPHRAPPPAAAAPAAMARRPRARSCAWRGSRAPPSVCRAAATATATAAAAAAAGRARALLGHFRVLPAGADAVTGGRASGRALRPPAAEGPLPRRRPFLRGVWRRRLAGGGRAPGGTRDRGWRMGGGGCACGRAPACARLALIHGRVHVLLFASEHLPPGRPSTAFPEG